MRKWRPDIDVGMAYLLFVLVLLAVYAILMINLPE